MQIRELPKAFLEVVYPRQCLRCTSQLGRRETRSLCDACWEELPIITPPFCPGCGVPFESPHAQQWSPEHLCQDCRQAAHRFDSARSAGKYEGPLRELILAYKMLGRLAAGRDCASLVRQHVRRLTEGKQLDVALNVPLHWRRLLNREFDQAGLLARSAAETLGIPFEEDVLARVVHTRSQTEVKPKERWKNVRGVFCVKRPAALEGRSVLLVDDVFTTGATVNECTRTLKKSGAAAVHVFTLGRRVG